MHILDIPEYAKSVAQERFVRDSAFLGVTETVCGFELKPLTLRNYLLLRILNSPLLTNEVPSPTEIAQFLWLNSAEYSLDDVARRRFLKRCRRFTPPPAPLLFMTKRWQRKYNIALIEAAKCVVAIRAYVNEAVMDAPPHKVGGGWKPDYYSVIAFWCGLFEYQYTPDFILNCPLKVLYQFFNEIRERKGDKPIMCNPSDSVRNKWQLEQQRN